MQIPMQKSVQKKAVLSTTIAIDSERSVFHFYSMEGNDHRTITHYVKRYTGRLFDDNFFKKFKSAVKEYSASLPSETVRKVTVVIPDRVVLTDIIRIPTMQGFGQTRKTLSVTLESIYRNFQDLRGGSHVLDQNKQSSIFAVTAVQKHFVSPIYSICSENKMLVDTLAYEAGTAVTGAQMINPRLKNTSYLFLDLKENYTRCVFVSKGKPSGFYKLPFGAGLLRRSEVVAEETLFDRSYADLAVMRAKEQAKSESEPEENEERTDLFNGHRDSASIIMGSPYEIVEKPPREIPEALRREIPVTAAGVRYENFRIFAKWAMSLIQNNERIVDVACPEFVCVNLPEDLADVIDKFNDENRDELAKEEQSRAEGDDTKKKKPTVLPFVRVASDGANVNIVANLELYGGLFSKMISPTGTL